MPGGDDPARVAAQLGHVDELHLVGVAAERVAQRREAAALEGHEHRLVALQPAAHERHGAVEQPVDAVVQQGFVAEAHESSTPGRSHSRATA